MLRSGAGGTVASPGHPTIQHISAWPSPEAQGRPPEREGVASADEKRVPAPQAPEGTCFRVETSALVNGQLTGGRCRKPGPSPGYNAGHASVLRLAGFTPDSGRGHRLVLSLWLSSTPGLLAGEGSEGWPEQGWMGSRPAWGGHAVRPLRGDGEFFAWRRLPACVFRSGGNQRAGKDACPTRGDAPQPAPPGRAGRDACPTRAGGLPSGQDQQEA